MIKEKTEELFHQDSPVFDWQFWISHDRISDRYIVDCPSMPDDHIVHVEHERRESAIDLALIKVIHGYLNPIRQQKKQVALKPLGSLPKPPIGVVPENWHCK